MELQNGYKVMYEAPARVTTEKPNKLYAAKTIPAETDAMLIAYNNGTQTVDLKTFKLIYSDGTHLLGSTTGIPTANDVNIVFKNTNSEVVFGEAIAVVEPVVKVEKKAKKIVEEPKVEEVKVEE